MNKNANLFASFICFVIAVGLVVYSWVPGLWALQEDQAKIIRIVPYPATRYNVEVLTSKGTRLSCVENALRKWPPSAINRCPIEKFYPLVGKTVRVLHDGRYIYEVKVRNETVLPFSVFHRFQLMMILTALLMSGMGIALWHRANSNR
jgi:hypothetical protein